MSWPRGLSLRVLFAALLALFAATPAFADDVAGKWAFETSKFGGPKNEDCQIVGSIQMTPTTLKNTYTCDFISEQRCTPDYGVEYIKVKQSCTAQRIGRQVAIKSRVVTILDRKPKVDPELAMASYLADNFIVTLSKNLSEMLGGHYDEQRNLKARFWREEELVS